MQAVAEKTSVSPSPKVLVFRTRMGAQPVQPTPPPSGQQPGWNPHRYGNLAQWVAPLITLVIGIISVSSVVHFRNADSAAKISDEHTNSLVEAKLGPAIDKVNGHIDQKVDELSKKLDGLSDRVSHIEGELDKRVSSLEHRADQQTSLTKLIDPSRVLATIRAEIQMAESSGKMLPASDLADYKNAVRALPISAYEYWTTAAAIINYQSKINQMSGEAPDPAKVSRPCFGMTNTNNMKSWDNTYNESIVSGCVVDLDRENFNNVTFKDSVIRYSGGLTHLKNVAFVNCTFQLDLESLKTGQEKHPLLFALLDSPDQKAITIR